MLFERSSAPGRQISHGFPRAGERMCNVCPRITRYGVRGGPFCRAPVPIDRLGESGAGRRPSPGAVRFRSNSSPVARPGAARG
ncbi:hypothetical protein GCM10010341_63150 [Streptomyces noursei]|nr:hypothetical protein GCM10010341_63150 [Streptomyces noursei]